MSNSEILKRIQELESQALCLHLQSQVMIEECRKTRMMLLEGGVSTQPKESSIQTIVANITMQRRNFLNAKHRLQVL